MSPPDTSDLLSYSPIEVESFLPPGWNLEEGEGFYETAKQRWRIEIQNVAELVSTLAVERRDAERLGRIPALRAAIDGLVRRA